MGSDAFSTEKREGSVWKTDQPVEKLGQPSRPRIERPRREVRVAALPEEGQQRIAPDKPRRTPIIQYRTRRWRPSEE